MNPKKCYRLFKVKGKFFELNPKFILEESFRGISVILIAYQAQKAWLRQQSPSRR